jgi:hypothetical protein
MMAKESAENMVFADVQMWKDKWMNNNKLHSPLGGEKSYF